MNDPLYLSFASHLPIGASDAAAPAKQTPVVVSVAEERQGEAVKEAFLRERKRLLAFIRQRIPQKEDAEDILHDVFFQLMENLRRLDPIEQVSAWLFRVTRNKIIDRYRKKKEELLPPVVSNEAEEEWTMGVLNLFFDPKDSPEEAYFRSAVWEELTAALAELPREQRDVFVWHELEGKSFKEISEETGVSVNTLLSRKRYAVLHLRKRLQDMYNQLNES